MLRWTVAFAAAALLRSPCRPCTGFLEGSVSSPCGCGTGIVRKVHTREELEAMTQAELDKLLRDEENELDEMGGALTASKKKHEEHIKEMNETTQAMEDELFNETDTKKSTYEDLKSNYSGEADEVKDLEGELKTQSDNITNLKFEFEQLHEEMEYQMMVLENCNCPEENLGLLAANAEAVLAGRPAAEGAALLSHHQAVLRQSNPGRQMMLKTAITIEKEEAKLVEATIEAQDEQSGYDAMVNALMATQEKMKSNHTRVSSRQVRDQESLELRSESQDKAKEALVKMVGTKTEQAETIAGHLHAAETQVAALKKKLAACGCS